MSLTDNLRAPWRLKAFIVPDSIFSADFSTRSSTSSNLVHPLYQLEQSDRLSTILSIMTQIARCLTWMPARPVKLGLHEARRSGS